MTVYGSRAPRVIAVLFATVVAAGLLLTARPAGAAPTHPAVPGASPAPGISPSPVPPPTPHPSTGATPSAPPSTPSPRSGGGGGGGSGQQPTDINAVTQLGGDQTVTARAPDGKRVPVAAFNVYYDVPDSDGGDDSWAKRAAKVVCGAGCLIHDGIQNVKDWANSGIWRLWGALLEFTWTMLVGSVYIVCWLLKWGLGFGFAEAMVQPINHVANTWKHDIVDAIGVRGLLLTIAAAWAGLLLLTGRYRRGLGYVAVSALIAGIGTIVMVNPASHVLGDDGVLGQARKFSVNIAEITVPRDEDHPQHGRVTEDDVSDAVNASLIDALLVKPHQMINYGQTMPEGQCTARYWKMVESTGKAFTGQDEYLRAHCTAKGFTRLPTAGRVVDVYVMGGAAVVVELLALVIIAGMLCAQAVAAYWSAYTIVAFTGGIVWRHLIRAWVIGICTSVVLLVAPVVLLTAYVSIVDAVFDAPANSGLPLLGREAIVVCLSIAMFFFRHRLVRGIKHGTRRAISVATTRAGNRPGAEPHQRGGPTLSDRMRTARSLAQGTKKASVVVGSAAKGGTKLAGSAIKGGAKTALTTGKFALMGTVGAPVYLPRGIKAVRTAFRARKEATAEKIAGRREQVKRYKDGKVAEGRAFAHEYKGNLVRMGQVVSRRGSRSQPITEPDPAPKASSTTRRPPKSKAVPELVVVSGRRNISTRPRESHFRR